MSKFLTEFDATLVNDDPQRWRLNQMLSYQSDVAGVTLNAPAGFVTDLASVPRVPIVFELLGGIGARAAVIHDALYTWHQYPRSMADAVLKEALIVCGVPKWKAWLMWVGVRAGGASHWDAPATPQN